MKVATVVEMDEKDVNDAIGEATKNSLPKGEHMGGRQIAIHVGQNGKVTSATVTFNGSVAK